MSERVGGDVQPLADYMKKLESETAQFWQKQKPPEAKGVLIAVGIKPGKKSHVWCEAVDGQIDPSTIQALETQLTAIETIDVSNGPIALALEYHLSNDLPKFPMAPNSWQEAAKTQKEPMMIPDGLFKVIWPD